jgi:hypothetical protein
MGMFDEIICDYPLPVTLEMVDWDIDIQGMSFQTKDLENLLDEYIISPQGELLHIQHQRVWVDDDNAFLKGYFETVDTQIVPAKYHGVVYFYCYEDLSEKDGRYYTLYAEYEAKFSDNKLTNLELFDYRIEDNTEHRLEMENGERQRREQENKWYNKYIINTKPVRFIRRLVYRFFYRLHNFTGKLHMLAVRYF